MPLDPPNVRVTVILRTGSAKHEVRSPEPMPRTDAEELIGKIQQALKDKAELDIPWLAASGEDVAAAYITIGPDDPQTHPGGDDRHAEREGPRRVAGAGPAGF